MPDITDPTQDPAPYTSAWDGEENGTPLTTDAIGEEGSTTPSGEEEAQSDGASVTNPFGAF
jgi:hypothetical protein